MSSLIKNLHIQNFKSVRDLSLECDRINIFIGKPNAGKSNILEAISLLGAGYSYMHDPFMGEFIRYQQLNHLFSDLDTRKAIKVETCQALVELKEDGRSERFTYSLFPSKITSLGDVNLNFFKINLSLSLEGNTSGWLHEQNTGSSPVKKYSFKSFGKSIEYTPFLRPPFGENLYFMARKHRELRDEIHQFLKPNGLDFLFDVERQRMAIMQKQEDSFISFPLDLVPDTFQRYIFHLAAIMSNRDSVLLFEEPESHSYAPYIYQLAQHILDDEGGNQFFITTHNPYLLTPILQEGKDVALFITWFENYRTHARRLSEEEVGDILNHGMDIFLNLNHFIPE